MRSNEPANKNGANISLRIVRWFLALTKHQGAGPLSSRPHCRAGLARWGKSPHRLPQAALTPAASSTTRLRRPYGLGTHPFGAGPPTFCLTQPPPGADKIYRSSEIFMYGDLY